MIHPYDRDPFKYEKMLTRALKTAILEAAEYRREQRIKQWKRLLKPWTWKGKM